MPSGERNKKRKTACESRLFIIYNFGTKSRPRRAGITFLERKVIKRTLLIYLSENGRYSASIVSLIF